ncbi:hypothetical protein IscW_ISCW000349, partial [Ixodes scapularis]
HEGKKQNKKRKKKTREFTNADNATPPEEPAGCRGLRRATTRSSMERTWKNERSCSGVTSSRNLRPHRLEPRKAGRRVSLCPVVPDPEADRRECTTEVATWRRANTPAGTDTRQRRRRAGSETRREAAKSSKETELTRTQEKKKRIRRHERGKSKRSAGIVRPHSPIRRVPRSL